MKLISLNLFQYMASERASRANVFSFLCTSFTYGKEDIYAEEWWWEVKFITLTRNVVVITRANILSNLYKEATFWRCQRLFDP